VIAVEGGGKTKSGLKKSQGGVGAGRRSEHFCRLCVEHVEILGEKKKGFHIRVVVQA